MKYLLILSGLFLSYFLSGQESQVALLEQANQQYVKGEYQQALSLYNQILQSGNASSELYYNLGNAYFKTGDYNHALLYYERALLLSPNDENIKFNIRMTNQYVVDNIEALPKPFFSRWLDTVVNLYSSDSWARLSIISFILFLLILGLFFFSRSIQMKRFSFWIGILFIVLSVFSFSFASRQKSKLVKRDNAIVFCPRVTVKSSPSASGTDLFLIHEGLKIQITDSLGKWKEIRLTDGNKGWLPDSCLVKI